MARTTSLKIPLASPPVKSNVEPLSTSVMGMRANCTTLPARLLRMPELTATPAGWPWRWRKRTTRATSATDPPTRPVKLLAYCTPITGPRGSGAMTEPIMANAEAIWGSWEMAKAAATHSHDADLNVLPTPDRPANWPISR